jgi:hypothetical protein
MRNLVAGDWPNRWCVHSRDYGGFSVERRELDFERFPVGVNVNHRADVANFETLSGHWLGQNDPIVLLDHFGWSLLAG